MHRVSEPRQSLGERGRKPTRLLDRKPCCCGGSGSRQWLATSAIAPSVIYVVTWLAACVCCAHKRPARRPCPADRPAPSFYGSAALQAAGRGGAGVRAQRGQRAAGRRGAQQQAARRRRRGTPQAPGCGAVCQRDHAVRQRQPWRPGGAGVCGGQRGGEPQAEPGGRAAVAHHRRQPSGGRYRWLRRGGG